MKMYIATRSVVYNFLGKFYKVIFSQVYNCFSKRVAFYYYEI